MPVERNSYISKPIQDATQKVGFNAIESLNTEADQKTSKIADKFVENAKDLHTFFNSKSFISRSWAQFKLTLITGTLISKSSIKQSFKKFDKDQLKKVQNGYETAVQKKQNKESLKSHNISIKSSDTDSSIDEFNNIIIDLKYENHEKVTKAATRLGTILKDETKREEFANKLYDFHHPTTQNPFKATSREISLSADESISLENLAKALERLEDDDLVSLSDSYKNVIYQKENESDFNELRKVFENDPFGQILHAETEDRIGLPNKLERLMDKGGLDFTEWTDINENIAFHNKANLVAPGYYQPKLEPVFIKKIKFQVLDDLYQKGVQNLKTEDLKKRYPGLDEKLIKEVQNEYADYVKHNDQIKNHLIQKSGELKTPDNQSILLEKITPPQTDLVEYIIDPEPGKMYNRTEFKSGVKFTANLKPKKAEHLKEGELCADMCGVTKHGEHIIAVSTDAAGNFAPSAKESKELNQRLNIGLIKLTRDSNTVEDVVNGLPKLISEEQRAAAIRIQPSKKAKEDLDLDPDGWKISKEAVVQPCTTAFCTVMKTESGKHIAVGATVGDSTAIVKKKDGTIKLLSPSSYSTQYSDNGGSMGDDLGTQYGDTLNSRLNKNETPYRLFSEELEEGDTIILGSDGLGDNLEAKTVLLDQPPVDAAKFLNENAGRKYNLEDFQNLRWNDKDQKKLQDLHEDFIKYSASQSYNKLVESSTKNANKPDDFNMITLTVLPK